MNSGGNPTTLTHNQQYITEVQRLRRALQLAETRNAELEAINEQHKKHQQEYEVRLRTEFRGSLITSKRELREHAFTEFSKSLETLKEENSRLSDRVIALEHELGTLLRKYDTLKNKHDNLKAFSATTNDILDHEIRTSVQRSRKKM